MTQIDSIKQLRRHLAALFDRRYQGSSGAAYAMSQGYIDGYMQAMSDLGVVNDQVLLDIVAEERARATERAEKCVSAKRTAVPVQHFA